MRRLSIIAVSVALAASVRKEGKKSMTIELAGGWDHDFEQD